MSTSALLVFLATFAFVAGQLLNRWLSRFVSLSGAEFLLVGVIMGPHMGLGLLHRDALMQLTPFASLLLGVLGFVIGVHARRSFADRETSLVGVLTASGVAALCIVVLATVLAFLHPPDHADWQWTLLEVAGYQLQIYASEQTLWPAVAVAAATAVVSPIVVRNTRTRLGSRGPVGDALASIAEASQFVGVLLLGFGLAAVRATGEANRFGIGVTEWALATVGASVACGLLFTLFIGRERDPSRVFLASIGAVTFAAGVGASLGIAPLFVTLFSGITVALTSPHAEELGEQLGRLRHPLFVMIMLLCGAHWVPAAGPVWLLIPLVTALRYGSMAYLSSSLLRAVPAEPLRVPRVASGLLAQGALAPAIALNFALIFPEHAPTVLTIVLACTLINDLWSLRALERLLLDAGEGPPAELQPEPEEGVA